MQLSVNETDNKRTEYPGKGLHIYWIYSITEKKMCSITCFCKRELIVCQFSSVQSLSRV